MFNKLRKVLEPEISAWLGAAAPICAAVSISISIALSPWFSWTHNALSDLGVSEVAPIFNSGLILTGILISIFAISFAGVECDSRLCFAGANGLFVMGVSIVGVGVFTEAFMLMHILFALACFISLTLSSILIGVHFIKDRENRLLGVFALPAGILSVIVWFAINMPGIAIKEALSASPAFVWFIALAMRLRRIRASKQRKV